MPRTATRTASALLLALSSLIPVGLRGQAPSPADGVGRSATPLGVDSPPIAALQERTREVLAEVGPSVAAFVRLPKERRQVFGRDADETDVNPRAFAAAVAIDAEGTLLTTYAAIGEPGGYDYFVLRAGDDAPTPAQLLAADPWSDLAALRAPGEWKPIERAAEFDVRRGDLAVALCNPFGLARDGELAAAWTMIGGTHRRPAVVRTEASGDRPETVHEYGNLLFIDAKATPGAQGGVLVDLDGRLIGLLTGMAAADGDGTGSLALPADDSFWQTALALAEGRRPEFGFLGIHPSSLDDRRLAAGDRGVFVDTVEDATPAIRAGLRPGDLILAIDGLPLDGQDDLFREIGKRPARGDVELTVLRRSGMTGPEEPFAVSVRLSKKRVETRRPQFATVPAPSWRGATVDDLSALPQATFLDRSYLVGTRTCLAISTVEPDSPAWNAGLRPGVLIDRVDGILVETPAEFYEIASTRTGVVPVRQFDATENPQTFQVAPLAVPDAEE